MDTNAWVAVIVTAIVTTVIGTLVGYFASTLQEHRRWLHRERYSAIVQRLHDVQADADDQDELARQHGRRRELDRLIETLASEENDPERLRDARRQLEAADTKLTVLNEQMQKAKNERSLPPVKLDLLGVDELEELALTLTAANQRVREKEIIGEEATQARSDSQAARQKYVDAARRELHISRRFGECRRARSKRD